MRCPGCNGELDERRGDSLTLSRCRGCGGLWIDNEGSVAVSRGTLGEADRQLLMQAESEPVADGGGAPSPPATRACPVCSAPMNEVRVPNTDVDVDVCAGHGTYFDACELVRLYQAVEIKNTLDDEAAAELGDTIGRRRADDLLGGSTLGRVLRWVRGS